MTVLRSATLSDAKAVAQLHALSWQHSYRDVLSDDYLKHRVLPERLAAWEKKFALADEHFFVYLAEEEGHLMGFIYIVGSEHPRWGSLLDNLHVHPDAKGKGVGKLLMRAGAKWVAERYNPPQMHLIVFESNRAACGFYEYLGGEVAERLEQPMPDGKLVPSIRYHWSDVNLALNT
ncbi:MAG: GNAT family N-acetyltransferase [Chloroflexota bacterium]